MWLSFITSRNEGSNVSVNFASIAALTGKEEETADVVILFNEMNEFLIMNMIDAIWSSDTFHSE
jgi:hypothetical protein